MQEPSLERRKRTPARAALEALAEALLPPGGSPEPGAADVDLMEDLENLLAGFTPGARHRVEVMAMALEFSTLLSTYLRSFSRLPPKARETFLQAAERRFPLRHVVAPLKMLCGMVYCSNPQIAPLLGDEGRPFKPLEGPLSSPATLPVRQYPELNRDEEEIADVAVVGSGAGGATVAAELARAGLSVVIIEEALSPRGRNSRSARSNG